MDSVALVKAAIFVCLAGIVVSLGVGLFHLVGDKGKSNRMVRALTIRIVLSVALFVFLILAWQQGWIHPHGLGR